MFPVDSFGLIITIPECKISEKEPFTHSATLPRQPVTVSGNTYCSVSFGNEKPCVSVSALWADAKYRMYHSNLLAGLVHRLVRTRKMWWCSYVTFFCTVFLLSCPSERQLSRHVPGMQAFCEVKLSFSETQYKERTV
jgi:hypothetical protein